MKKIACILLLFGGLIGAACGSDVVPVPDPSATSVPVDSGRGGKDTVVAPRDSTKRVVTDTLALPMDSIRAPKDTAKTGTTKPPVTPPSQPPPPPIVPPFPADTISPTGRSPRLIWTPQRQATWARMQRENHPLFQLIQRNCRSAANGSARYGDRGLWCAQMYQITGNTAYARVAWNVFQPLLMAPPANDNDIRENLIENAVLFDWLYPALTPVERETAVAGLNSWAVAATSGGIRLGDGDANVGYYFGLAAIDLATAGLSSHHVSWVTSTQTAGTVVPIGGLDATGVNRQTLRNMIALYVAQNSAGGEWDESSQYNMGTQVLLAMGSEAIRTATGMDHFPEITAYLADAARSQGYFITPDLNQSVQWGDNEHPRDLVGTLWKLDTWLGTVAGITQWNSGAGAYAKGLVDAIFAKYGMTGYGSGEPWARFFLFYNPYAPSADWAAGTPGKYFPGTGHLFVHSNNELFEARMANRTGEDHEVHYLSDFQLYRNGEWAITHPIGYGGSADLADGVNSLLLAGLSAMSSRRSDGMQSGNNWWSISGSTNGMFYDMPFYEPPPAFVRNANRTVVYLQRNGFDIVVVQDALDMDDPKSLPNLSWYRAADVARINAAAGLVQWVMHAPVMPTVNGNVASWRTLGGQPVSVTTLSPVPTTSLIIPEQSALTMGYYYSASEVTGFQLRVVPAFTGGQLVLRHVIIVGAEGAIDVHLTGNTIYVGSTAITIGAIVQVTN